MHWLNDQEKLVGQEPAEGDSTASGLLFFKTICGPRLLFPYPQILPMEEMGKEKIVNMVTVVLML